MKGLSARALALLLVASAALLVPAPAEAVSRVWTFQNVVGVASAIQQGDGTVSLSVLCPNEQTPVAGWVIPSQQDDLRRRSESLGRGPGAGYSVSLENQTPGTAVITVTPHVRCVAMSNFAPGTTITTPPQVFQVNDSTQLAEGEATCPANYQVISGSVSFSGTGGRTLLTTAPSAGPGWEARGWHEDDLATMSVTANCVLTSDLPGGKIHGALDPVGFGAPASRGCPPGTALITGGTFHVGGDGQGLTINQRLTTSGSSTGWASTTIANPDNGGAMQTRVLCMPTGYPTVQVTGSSGYTNGNSATWSFTATDPAAGGGYTMSTTCSFTHPTFNEPAAPCTSPQTKPGLTEGLHTITVTATTSDGRTGQGFGSVIVDTSAPTVEFADPQGTLFATASPTIGFTVSDAAPVGTLSCWVDNATPAPCDVGSSSDYRGRDLALALNGLSQGQHTLHVRPSDPAANSATYDLAFRVDSLAPSVLMTKPSARFQLASSATAAWSGQDAATGTGIAGYSVRYRRATHNTDFGAPSAPTSLGPSITSKTYTGLQAGSTYCYSVTARDHAGNQSAPSTKCTAVPLDDRSLTRSTGWTLSRPSGWFKGTAVSTTKRGATLSKGATLKRIAVVAQKCPTCGVVGLYVNSTLVGRVNLSAARSSKTLINVPAFALRTGTVRLKVLSSGKLVKIDALGLSRS